MKMRDLAQLISTFLVVTLLGVAALLAVSSASAQTSTTGSIEGTIIDTTGAAVPGLTVTATGRGGSTGSATTNDEGFFRILNLQPGRYTVAVEASKWFAKFEQADVEVNLSRSTNVGIQLRPVGAAESVSVTQTTTGGSASVKTADGLTTITFEPKAGTVRVILPDDMRAGDTISGTLVTEPKGQTEEERKKNLSELGDYAITLDPQSSTATASDGVVNLPVAASNHFAVSLPATGSDGSRIRLRLAQTKQDGQLIVGVDEVKLSVRMDDAQVDSSVSGSMRTTTRTTTPAPGDFRLPTIGQQGRPLEIFGPFDGNSSNTTLRFGPPGSTVQDFEKGTENVSGGFGLIRPLAESPRKIVFEVPANLIGPIELNVKDGSNQATGTHRNVGVSLSAPNTSLLKGQKTILTTEVSGLQGITKAVPLTLTSEGVITMEGGPFQQFMIKPSEVNASGKYTTTRQVTGIMAGGWGATATVVTGRFNVWLQDDSDPNRIFHFNSFTGDYIFACGGGSCRSGTGGTSSQPPTGSSAPPPPVTLTGIGRPAMKGCIITLSHNAPDRRVFARLDACTKTGDASVETKSPKANFNITDKNTTDNPVAAPPK